MDTTELIRQMQLERVKGELRALKLSYYNPMGNNVLYEEVNALIEGIIHELDNELG